MKDFIKLVDNFVQEVKISEVQSEKAGEIVIFTAWMTALYYGPALMIFTQAGLILEGTRNQSKYEFNTSPFWMDFIFLSLTTLVIGAIAGFIIGLLHGCLISLIYHKNTEVSSQPRLLKIIVNTINLFVPAALIILQLIEVIQHNYVHSIENLGLSTLAITAAAFYTSQRFWRWWTQDTFTPSA